MKKFLVTGIVVLLAVFLGTCEAELPEEEIEYTDVVYSQDGSQVTLYLDGVGVPITKAQRAMTVDLSKMAYDYLEVVFISSGTQIARSQWELGQSAGISGVARGTAATGVDYAWATSDTATDPFVFVTPIALMAVGSKDGKTLLGVGRIGNTDNQAVVDTTPADGYPDTPRTTIYPATDSVTFYIDSVRSGLLVGSETIGTPPGAGNDYNIKYNSFTFTDDPTIHTGASRTTLGGTNYPMYALPNATGAPLTQKAKYVFEGAPKTYAANLLFKASVAPYSLVERRIPRYQSNGRYLIPKGNVNTKTTVVEDTGYAAATKNEVPLLFTRNNGTGIFSFYIDIPVYLMTKTLGTNGGDVPATLWHVRTGFGSELYSLDDGSSTGGCVLMGVGVGSLDWLNIEWEWVP